MTAKAISPERDALTQQMKRDAAEEMYAALKAIYEELDNRYDGAEDSRTKWMAEYLPWLRDALAKADGGSK